MSWLTVVFFLVLAALALGFRLRAGSWASPAAFFAAAWTVLAGLPMLVGPIPIAPAGLAFLVAASLSVFAGARIADRRWHGVREPRSPAGSWPLLEWLIVACTIGGLTAVLLVLASRGHGPQIFFSPRLLQTAAHDYAAGLEGRTWQLPYTARVLVTSNYLGALLMGMVLGIRRTGWQRWLSLVALLPSALMAYLLTTKASLLVPLALAAGSYLATRISAEDPIRPTLRAVALAGAAGAMLGGYFVVVHMSRYEFQSLAGAVEVIKIFELNLFPYMGVFSAWLQHGGWADVNFGLGYYTFAGPFDLLHIANRAPGLYGNSSDLPGVAYNIYTAFRGLIEDFSLPGALLVLGLIGFGAQRAYLGVRGGDLRYAAALAAFYAFVGWSFIVNIFSYNTIVAATFLFAAYLWLAAKPSVGRATARLDMPWRNVGASPAVPHPADR